MYLLELQNTPAWQSALEEKVKTTTWLSGDDYKYTGEGIIVGVYDTGIDFFNPAFLEYDVEKKGYVFRRWPYNNTIGSHDLDSAIVGEKIHGTKVAGVIGGEWCWVSKFHV